MSHQTTESIGNGVLMVCLWVMTYAAKLSGETAVLILTAIGSGLYLCNQGFTLYNNIRANIKKRKQ